MPSPRNLARIMLLLFSLITNFILEPKEGEGYMGVNSALAAAPIPTASEDDVFFGARRIAYFHGETALDESTGTIDLTWTAPGDDADSGRADHYVIKFSNDPLSETNWAQAFTAPNPPAPLDAGTPQAYMVTGLECGRRYYLAVKAFDESGNVSPISNIADAFASGIMAPTLIGADIDTASGAVSLYANPVEAAMPVFYEFAVDSLPSFADPLLDIDMVVDTLVSVTFTQLQDDVVYFWRCRAVAVGRTDSSAWSSIDSFLIYMPDLVAPTVAVTSPNGGETLEVGSIHTIRWDCDDNIGVNSCRVEFSSDNGSSWTILQNWADVHDSISWIVPDSLSTQCLVRVSARDGALNIGSDISDAVFALDDWTAPTVTIADPIVGDSVTLGWTALDNGLIAHYLIDYTTDGGQSWLEVASGPGGDSGAVTLPIPDQIPALGIRVTCYDQAENAGADTLVVTPTSADDHDGAVPSAYYLAQSYPNPFNPSATIAYGLPVASHVIIEIFDITGARITVLQDEYREAGDYNVVWHANDVTSGTYFYRIVAGSFNEVGKATLMK